MHQASTPAKKAVAASEATLSTESSRPFAAMKKHTLSSSGGQAVAFAEKAPVSMFSVDAPDALVLSVGALSYSDAKVANRDIRVWHGATETGP